MLFLPKPDPHGLRCADPPEPIPPQPPQALPLGEPTQQVPAAAHAPSLPALPLHPHHGWVAQADYADSPASAQGTPDTAAQTEQPMDEDSMDESAAGSADNSSRDADGDFNLSPVETRRYADNSDSEDEPVRPPGKSKYIARVKSAAAMNPELYGLRRSVSIS
jgi:hypothetical protein